MSKLFFNFASKIRQGRCGEFFAKAWHKLAPPIPIWKKIYGVNVCLDFRDSLVFWATDSKQIEKGEGFDRMLKGIKGNVWDVGCNIGIFSLYAASQNLRVIAFDISPKATALLQKGADRNSLDISTVTRALAINSFKYAPPANADSRNRPTANSAQNTETSITFLEAEAQFGRPNFIKLDIEYAEVDFLKSAEFKNWIKIHRIPLLIELHESHFWDLVWPDVPHIRFDECHVLFNPVYQD